MKILIATHSLHKTAELVAILSRAGIDTVTLADIDPDQRITSPDETGSTLHENAELKARHYYEHAQMPVLADDSGLEVLMLNGEPGVRTARYAGDNATRAENRAKLLAALQAFEGEQRAATFRTVLCYYDGRETLCAEGSMQGRIVREPRGENGFAYDPLFELPSCGLTYGELPDDEKSRISHRAQAVEAFVQLWRARQGI